jgi:Uncharacterized protein conserved in bacteria (DUF2062)
MTGLFSRPSQERAWFFGWSGIVDSSVDRFCTYQRGVNPTPVIAPSPVPPLSWRGRLVALLRVQLTQGVTPDRVALSVAVGTACSLVPFFGFTTVLNLGIGAWLRLNQPVMQILNQLLGPVQLVLIVVYVRLGEKIWGAAPVPMAVSILVKAFKDDPWAFLQRFGWTGVHAATAWALSVPLLVGGVHYALRPVMRRFAALRSFTENAPG